MWACTPQEVSLASSGQSAKSTRSVTVPVESTATLSRRTGHRLSFWLTVQALAPSAGDADL
nr:hypothetical protein GCM10020092_073310 [Actinoplanes digitatis]